MSRVSHAAFLLLASLALAAAQPAVVTDVDISPSTERPEGLVGQWIGRYVAASGALEPAEGATALFSAHEGVVENVGVIFDPTVTDKIAAVWIVEHGPYEARGDGYVMLARVKATTADSPYGVPGDIRCAAFCIEEDRLYVHAKVTRKFVFFVWQKLTAPSSPQFSGVESFDDCPPVPDPTAFAEGAPPMDLESIGADHAAVFERTTSPALKDRLGTPTDAEWPEQLPGLWKGETRIDTPGIIAETSTTSPSPTYVSITQGAAPNAWIFLDPEDESKIVSANVNVLANVESFDTHLTFTNAPWKYTADMSAGKSTWCNTIVLNEEGDASYVLSADAPAGEEVKCPAAPEDRAGIIGELDGDGLLGDDELMEASGAVAAHVLRKQ
jgi:hypothetical protein